MTSAVGVNIVTVSYVVTIGVAVLGLIVGGVKYTLRAVVAVSRWLVLWEAVATQFQPNHGTSLVDRVAKVEQAVARIEVSLAGDEIGERRTKRPGA